MKRVTIAVFIIAGIIAYSAAAALIIRKENAELIEIIGRIGEYNQIGDTESASAAAEMLCKKWDRFERKMNVFVRDDKLNALSASVAKIPPYITAANDELDAELESIRRQLNLIYRAELPLWYNIL